MKSILLTSILALFSSVAIVTAQPLKVAEIEFGTDVKDRDIVNENTFFDATVGRVYCLTRIVGAQDTTKIKHIWYYENDQKERIELEIRSDNWRTWSYKTIPSIWTGDWRVEVWDSNGNVLGRKTFTVRENHD